MRRGLVVGLLACLVLTSCASDMGTGSTRATSTPHSVSPLSSTPSGSGPASTLQTAAGLEDVDPTLAEHASWFLHVLSTGDVTEADYQSRFTDSFKDQISYQEFAPGLAPLATEGWAVNEVVTNEEDFVQADIAPNEDEPVLRMSLRVDDSGKMSELSVVVAPITELENPPSSLDEAVGQLGEFGDVTLLAAEVSGGECDAIEEVGADGVIPLGSAFKLWVLAALADAIEGGEVSWDDTLTVTEELKSLPTGRLQDAEPGTTVTVEEAARAMISISDNTATDMIIEMLGRDTLEKSLDGRMADPSTTIPFMTTREFFILKFGEADRLANYGAADVAERRAILEGIADEPLPGLDAISTDPVAIHEVEWFATPGDLCAVMAELASRFDDPGLEPLREILTTNPGVPSEEWDTVAYKGGSENGVLVSAWYIANTDKARILVSAVTNEEESFRPDRASLIMAAARDLLANSQQE